MGNIMYLMLGLNNKKATGGGGLGAKKQNPSRWRGFIVATVDCNLVSVEAWRTRT